MLGLLDVRTECLDGAREVEDGLGERLGHDLTLAYRRRRGAGEYPHVAYRKIQLVGRRGVEPELAERPPARRGEPDGIVSGVERLPESVHASVYVARLLQGALGPTQVAPAQSRSRLLQSADEVVEDRMRRPLHQVPRVARKYGPHPERHARSEERVHEALGRPTRGRWVEHDGEQRRHARLGDERGPAPEQPRHHHRQRDDDPDLDGTRTYEHHEQVRDGKPAGDAEDELEYPPPLLANDDARRDYGCYGCEIRLVVPERRRSQKPRKARRHSRLQDGPHPGPQPSERLLEPASHRPGNGVRHDPR